MAAQPRGGDYRGFLLLSILLGTLWEAWAGRILYSVSEETDKGSFVGDIAKDLGLEPQELAERGVRIVSRSRTQLFALNPRSGSLVTAGRIDREEICAQSARCLVNFNILMEDKMNLYPIDVEIIDINDNVPRFLTEEINNTAPGIRFPLSEAGDPDVGTNSLHSYQLSPNRHFSLAVQSGDDGTKYPELVLERVLDREEERVHHLVLTASDGGDPPRSSTARIQVTVVDVNDHAPVFFLPQYQVTVPENVPVGTKLLTVHAIDLDEGVNGEVTYSFRKITPKLLQMFHLNSLTGELSTLEGLDYEETGFYEMEVQAQDVPGSLTKAKVLITVLDVNDNAPEVIMTSLSSSIPEDTPLGTVIALFYVQDRDSGKNGEVTYWSQPKLGPGNTLFNNPRGASIFLVTAQDQDSEENAQVTYSLAEDTIQGGPVSSYVSINSDTGVLYVLQSFDFEQLRELQLTVTARDSGDPPLSSNMSLSLFVLDQNDNPPEILYPALPTDGSTGVELAPRSADPVDKDSGQNAWLSYLPSWPTLGSLEPLIRSFTYSDPHAVHWWYFFFRLRRGLQSRGCRLQKVGLASGAHLRTYVGMDGGAGFPADLFPTRSSLTSDSQKSHLIFPQPNYDDNTYQPGEQSANYSGGSPALPLFP
uniref:Protocadherin gamma subfamily A, 7 n=1 Tax=Rhinopithecus bieti TaxID=61621 RepID=A0A2K6KQW8_RHIBE